MCEGFVFYRSFAEALDYLDPADFKECVTALYKYALDGEEVAQTSSAKMFMALVKPQIDANAKRRACGKQGGRPKNQIEPSDNQTEPNGNQTEPNDNQTKPNCDFSEPKDKDKDKDKDKVKVKDKEKDKEKEKVKDKAKERNVFIPPTLDEVRDYCAERCNNVDPERWMNHYQSNGFMVGKTKMKDWRASIRTWERTQDVRSSPTANRLDIVDQWAAESRYAT